MYAGTGLCESEARDDHVDGDVPRTEIPGELVGQRLHPRFRGTVGHPRADGEKRPEAPPRGHGREVHDAPVPLGLHMRHRGPASEKGSLKVHVHDSIPQLLARVLDVGHADGAAASSIVNEDVDVTERLHRGVDEGLHLIGRGDVSGYG